VRKSAVLLLLLAALSLSACGGGGSSEPGSGGSSTSAGGGGTGSGGAETAAGSNASGPEQVWAKEVEGVMRRFENSSAQSVEAIHTSTSQFHLEPTYARYSEELTKLGTQLEATDPPASCERLRDQIGLLSHKVSQIMGVLGDQHELSPEEYSALAYQQSYKFSRVGRRLTNLTIHPHC
jgi:hypothetical protein